MQGASQHYIASLPPQAALPESVLPANQQPEEPVHRRAEDLQDQVLNHSSSLQASHTQICHNFLPSAFTGSVEGEEEVFIFIERVKKGDIHVRFFEVDENEDRPWEELAEFQEGDVHHQYAIAFKTPR
jgi:hypothetical protein